MRAVVTAEISAMAFYPLIPIFILLPEVLSYDYDVFLSFRGSDTRFSFADHLYDALVEAQLRTFRDHTIPEGADINLEIIRAIGGSKASIIVFSKDFANSPWCLDEVAMFMDRRETSGHIVLPVFYYVDPSHVGDQTGTYGDAFDEYEKLYNGKMDRVEKWRKALKRVADLKGMVYPDQDRFESEFIQHIVKTIQKMLNHTVPANNVVSDINSFRDALLPMGSAFLVIFLLVFQHQIRQAVWLLIRYISSIRWIFNL